MKIGLSPGSCSSCAAVALDCEIEKSRFGNTRQLVSRSGDLRAGMFSYYDMYAFSRSAGIYEPFAPPCLVHALIELCTPKPHESGTSGQPWGASASNMFVTPTSRWTGWYEHTWTMYIPVAFISLRIWWDREHGLENEEQNWWRNMNGDRLQL